MPITIVITVTATIIDIMVIDIMVIVIMVIVIMMILPVADWQQRALLGLGSGEKQDLP